MVTSTVSIVAFAIFNVCTSAVEKRLLQAEDGVSGSGTPSLSPTEPPTYDCGLELPYRRMMPMCQLMHGDKRSCEGAYVQYAIRGETESRKWAEPCIYFNEGEACLPFPPCMKEETWIPIELKSNSTSPSNSSTPAPSIIATIEPSRLPSLAPSHVPTSSPTHSPTYSPTRKPTAKPTFEPTAKPTSEPTEAPTPAPTADHIVCAGKKKGRCRNTKFCRYVNKNKGCVVRIRPCSFFNKKSQCKNSHGCAWMKESFFQHTEGCVGVVAN